MLRTLVVLLLLANLLFFAWTRGVLSPLLLPPHHGEREPERLAAQVRPEAIRLLTPQAASKAAAEAAQACVEAGPFGDDDVRSAEAALAAAGVPADAVARREVQPPAVWLVYMGRFADAALQRTKAEELRRLKVNYEDLREPPELAPGLALSRHDSRAAAEAALAQTMQRGVQTAKVVALPPPPLQLWLRAGRADAELQSRLAAIRPPAIAAPFAACAKAP